MSRETNMTFLVDKISMCMRLLKLNFVFIRAILHVANIAIEFLHLDTMLREFVFF
jgi:hypothetical protein